MLEYYPERPDIAKAIRQYPELGIRNYPEEIRLQDVEDKKARGKGTPKKAKTKGAYQYIFATTTANFLILSLCGRVLQRNHVVRKRNGSGLCAIVSLSCCIICHLLAPSHHSNCFLFVGFTAFTLGMYACKALVCDT